MVQTKAAILTAIRQNGMRLRDFGVARIGLFGSFVRGQASAASDVDILVEFAPKALSFDNYMGLKLYLEETLGRPIDLVIQDDLKDELKAPILATVEYA